MPEKFSQMGLGGGEATTAAETDEDAKKRQKRGGKGIKNIIYYRVSLEKCNCTPRFLMKT